MAAQAPFVDDGLVSDMAGVSIKSVGVDNNDEQPVQVTSSNSSAYAGTGRSGFSPTTERYTPPFVRNGGRSRSEDPFRSTPVRRADGPSTPKSARRAHYADNWRSGGSSSGGSVIDSPLKSKVQRDDPGRGSGFPTVRPEEAQALYPPSCCVFVANLLSTEHEDVLQMAVTQAFREYGPVYVKIRRDGKQMPFAFCQYTQPEHAERAIREGRGRLIKGRPCRCEKAKAHRLFLVERKFGAVITPDEVRGLLAGRGSIDACYTASQVERTALNLNEGVIVQFTMYDDGQNALSAFRHHELYKITAIAGLGSPSRQMPTPPADVTAYLHRYESDRNSIFVGGLPAGSTENQIRQLFAGFGNINDVLVRQVPSKYDAAVMICFAFVEFVNATSAVKAIEQMNGYIYNGNALRVTQKDSERVGVSSNARRSTAPSGPSYVAPQVPSAVAPAQYQSPNQGWNSPQAAFPYGPQGSPQYSYYGGGYPYYAGYFPSIWSNGSPYYAYDPYGYQGQNNYQGHAPLWNGPPATGNNNNANFPVGTGVALGNSAMLLSTTTQDGSSETSVPVEPASVSEDTPIVATQ